jgi:hypothetical protein
MTFELVVITVVAYALTAVPDTISFEPIAFAQTGPGPKAPPPPPTSSHPMNMLCPGGDVRMCLRGLGIPIATSGNNVYMAWPNNDTGHWKVFFAKSIDGGKTLKTMMISAPNKGNTINQNTQISASGSNVYVTWWTNKTGVLMPVFRASNDNGDTFAKALTLNSTG